MVHALLQSAVEVGEGLRGRAEAHAFAQVVPPLLAVVAVAAHNAAFNSNTLTDSQSGDLWSESSYDPGGLVAEH